MALETVSKSDIVYYDYFSTIRGIEAIQHESTEFVCTLIYFLGNNVRQQQMYISIT